MHRKLAHQAVLEWTLAMSALKLPPYVLEHLFNSVQIHSTNADYQQRKAMDFLWIPPNGNKVNANFVHLLIEERTHAENIKMFISIHKVAILKE